MGLFYLESSNLIPGYLTVEPQDDSDVIRLA